jgi:alanine-alpha-ketoisovalerate/valine-pyruvate aminotransferase
MDQLCEPIEINKKFIKMIEKVIKPQYEKQLNDVFSLLKKDIDEYYLTRKNSSQPDPGESPVTNYM